jgi:hypothetical protein
VHEVVSKEEAAAKTVRALKEQYGDWHLATGHSQQLRKRTQGDGGSWKKLATTYRGMTSHAMTFLHHARNMVIRDHAKDNVVHGTHKGWIFGKRHWVQQECSKGIRVRELKE